MSGAGALALGPKTARKPALHSQLPVMFVIGPGAEPCMHVFMCIFIFMCIYIYVYMYMFVYICVVLYIIDMYAFLYIE